MQAASGYSQNSCWQCSQLLQWCRAGVLPPMATHLTGGRRTGGYRQISGCRAVPAIVGHALVRAASSAGSGSGQTTYPWHDHAAPLFPLVPLAHAQGATQMLCNGRRRQQCHCFCFHCPRFGPDSEPRAALELKRGGSALRGYQRWRWRWSSPCLPPCQTAA